MSHPSIPPRARALAALVLLFVIQYALPSGGAAQQPLPGAATEPLLQGVVVQESTGQPVASATVSLVGTDIEVQTVRYGAFAFPDVAAGMMSLRVTAPGYISVVQEVEVKADGIIFVEFRLPSISAVLSELLVGVRRDEPTGTALTAADLLAIEVPSSRVTTGFIGHNDYTFRLRASASSLTLRGEPLILLDGVMISSGGATALDALKQIPASDVIEIEVLRGPAATARYPLAANGVVLVKTRAGGGR